MLNDDTAALSGAGMSTWKRAIVPCALRHVSQWHIQALSGNELEGIGIVNCDLPHRQPPLISVTAADIMTVLKYWGKDSIVGRFLSLKMRGRGLYVEYKCLRPKHDDSPEFSCLEIFPTVFRFRPKDP